MPPVGDAGSGSDAATFVCDTIRGLRSEYAGVENDLTAASWINGFLAALSDAPDAGVYGEVVDGSADAPAAALCPEDWAEYLARAEVETLQGIDQ